LDDASGAVESTDGSTPETGQVTQGVVDVRGGPVNDVARKIATLRPGMRRCYFDALTRAEGARGDVTFTIEVGVDGKVETVRIKPDDGSRLDAAMLKCLEGRFKIAEFEMAKSASAATLTFRASFQLTPPAPGRR
jgi:outer membrane biosynthesis protein TonB